MSAVTGLALARDGARAVSVGRDSVAILWDLAAHARLATVPCFHPAEGVTLLEDGRCFLYSQIVHKVFHTQSQSLSYTFSAP